MAGRRRFRGIITWLVVVGLAATGVGAWHWYGHRARAVTWSDGTAAYFRGASSVAAVSGYPRPRELRLNGDVFLRVADKPEPLVVRTRLMILTITGEAVLRITAWAYDTGEEALVVRGKVEARKAYASAVQQAPDRLAAGDMVMVNQTIDLMEKEKFDPAELRPWSEGLVKAAGTPELR